MSEISPEKPSEPQQENYSNRLVVDIRHQGEFERIKRTSVGQESISSDELADLEVGLNNCAAA